jgi:hypothetical protein
MVMQQQQQMLQAQQVALMQQVQHKALPVLERARFVCSLLSNSTKIQALLGPDAEVATLAAMGQGALLA